MKERLKRIKQRFTKSNNTPTHEPASSSGNGGYIELADKPVKKQQANIFVRYCVLDEFSDVKPILDFMREGYSICMVKIKPLREKDINELKRAITKIKRVADVMKGDVVGMDEDYLIISPSFVKVFKGGPAKKV